MRLTFYVHISDFLFLFIFIILSTLHNHLFLKNVKFKANRDILRMKSNIYNGATNC